MPTLNEIAQGYAKDIRAALANDNFRKGISVTESQLRYSETASTLKRIASDLDQYSINGEPLTHGQRDDILRKTGEFIDAAEAAAFPRAVKNASNDAYNDLVADIYNILNTR